MHFSPSHAIHIFKAAWNFSRGTQRVLTLEGAAILAHGPPSAGPKALLKRRPSEWVWGPPILVEIKEQPPANVGCAFGHTKQEKNITKAGSTNLDSTRK
jgi:hypothetical protein